MAVIRKYEFDLSFDPPTAAQIARRRAAELARAQAEAEAASQAQAAAQNAPPPAPPEPTYSLAELQSAENAARDQGYAEGVASTERLTQARLVEATEALRAQMHAIGDTQARAMEAVERQAAHLTLLSLRKLFPAYLERSGTQEIEALLHAAFEQALDEPRILVRCPEDVREALEPVIHRTAELAGFDGKLSIISDPGLARTDCRIEWAEGGIERDTRAFLAAVEKAIGGSLGAAAALPEGGHHTTLPPEATAVESALEETAG
jgi:flagellar assembly protein FliH